MNRVKYLGIALTVVISLFLILSQAVYASSGAGTSGQAALTGWGAWHSMNWDFGKINDSEGCEV